MKVFNSMTREKEEFRPIEPGRVTMYACGPTVYNLIHIGNARPLCVFDVLRRYLEWRGFKVNFVQNFTDIDDKIINRANEEGTDYKTIAERYIAEQGFDRVLTGGVSSKFLIGADKASAGLLCTSPIAPSSPNSLTFSFSTGTFAASPLM